MRNKLFITAALFATLMFSACSDGNNSGNSGNQSGTGENPKTGLVENISIQGGNLVLQTGTKTNLSVFVGPDNAINKNITWSSSSSAVASVSKEGEVSALATGITIIIAEAADDSCQYDQITVTVQAKAPLKVDSITILEGNLNLQAGMITALNAVILPLDAGNRNVDWSSSDETIAEVDEFGLLNAIAEGKTTIIAAARDKSGAAGTITVTVGTPAEPGEPTEPGGSEEGEIITPPGGGENVDGDVKIIESAGWLETFFVTWEKFSGAAKYNVYFKGENITEWTKIDDNLIREYGTFFRADIPGIKAGVYEVKIHPVNNGGTETGNPGISSNIQVTAHRRHGYGFLNGAEPGAYKLDGTPKEGARVIYITEKTKETVQIEIINNTNERSAVFTGLQNILSAYEKGYESRPLIIRFIGMITEKKNSDFSDKEGSVMIKGNSTASRPNNVNGMNITFEGIGNDAAAHGWGFRTSRANNVEIRNLGFMLTNTSQKDSVELTGSRNMWVHNNDFFYGKPGSASDQAKGDGSLDIKESDLVTLSFNHFWDSGKSSLLGNGKNEPMGRITYHHNWFDHSDSRHPRVRIHTVHIFNNLYDGIAKYGTGATLGSSIFIERNYFRNTRRPMLISKQGSDIMSGPGAAAGSSDGTFSSENGGMIKSFDNYMDAYSKQEYRPWSLTNQIEFDAYEVSSAGEIVPSSVTAKQGGAVYNNFDTITAFYAYTSDAPDIARQNVEAWAGRYWKGDFTFTFNTATDRPLADTPMPALLAALNNYESGLIKIQGE